MREKKLLLLLILAVGIYSCTKNDPTPSSGSDRDKFIGTWHVTSHHTQFPTQFWDLTVVADANAANQILLDNFNEIGTTKSIYGAVSGNSISIGAQTVNNEIIQGTGTYISNGTLSFNYTSNDGINTDTVSATAHK